MDYEQIEEQLVRQLPEIRGAAETYWSHEGRPGEDRGPYIFVESMFCAYLEVLLHLKSSPQRDHLLTRAFAFVEAMLESPDKHVRDLGYIGVLEGRSAWWLQRSKPFLGSAALAALDQEAPRWDPEIAGTEVNPDPEIIDLHGVRRIVAAQLGCSLEEVPGRTHVT
jgi:hypothetical protein